MKIFVVVRLTHLPKVDLRAFSSRDAAYAYLEELSKTWPDEVEEGEEIYVEPLCVDVA